MRASAMRDRAFLERMPAAHPVQAVMHFAGLKAAGESAADPLAVPNNLMPFFAQVAIVRRPALRVFGNDYPASGGTGVRDCVHVTDLVDGHVAALQRGPGRPCGRTLPCEIVPRRAGDVAACWADPTRARQVQGWSATRSLARMRQDTWRRQSRHPEGSRATSRESAAAQDLPARAVGAQVQVPVIDARPGNTPGRRRHARL